MLLQNPMTPEQMGKKINDLWLSQARYIIYDFSYNTKSDGRRDKLLFVSWIPDKGLKIKDKMVYASTRERVKGGLQGIAKDVPINDLSMFTTKDFLERVGEDLSKIEGF